ncbi:hypothetical protein GOBAR_AA10717 [Gossypium barbadense]|uniref:Uncharacterized protein n=1 Tax=Gossypium barbadense TaxID=3634 RepID=A0A2P5Y321_GOSBA|nr:hypothetical protein GOBAR_AA10717 [Gossypium barbadense]
MAETEQRTKNQWLSSQPSSTVEISGHDLFIAEPMITRINGSEFCAPQRQKDNDACNLNLGIGEKTFSAAGAAFLSAIIVNPLDVVKTRLQAQAAGVPYSHPLNVCGFKMLTDAHHHAHVLESMEGFSRLWRGTNAGLALAVPTVGIYLPCYDIFRNWMEGLAAEHIPIVTLSMFLLVAGSSARSIACATCYPIELARTRMQFSFQSQAVKDTQIQKKPPGVFSTLVGVLSNVKGTNPQNSSLGYRVLWTDVGAQLARDVPFSGICWSTLEPLRRRLLSLAGKESNIATILGANFSAGFVAGSLAAAATCPLDVAKTRR